MGRTALEKATISSWERRAYDEGLIGHAEIFRNFHPNFVDRGLPGYHEKIPQIPALIERGEDAAVAHFYQKFNNQLADNESVAGDAFSVADITTIVTVDFGLALTMPIPGNAPHVRRCCVRRDAEAAERSRERDKARPRRYAAAGRRLTAGDPRQVTSCTCGCFFSPRAILSALGLGTSSVSRRCPSSGAHGQLPSPT